MKKTPSAVLATVIFLFLLAAIYGVHIYFFRVDVVFYAAIADALLAAGVASVLMFFTRSFKALANFEKSQLVIIWILTGYALAISLPTVIDRSLSFYILEKIQQRGGGIRFDGFEQVFTQEYVKEHRLVDVRITEQIESGTVILVDGCVKLTEKGDRLASMSRYFRAHWLPRHRLLMGSYSDALVDPFKSGISTVEYKCQ
jgi:hypothetical protein